MEKTASTETKKLDGFILMGPFGTGKSYLGKRLNASGIAHYTDLEPIVYELFGNDSDLDIEQATKYIRAYYYDSLSAANQEITAFESTGVVQRPLLEEIMEKFEIALIRIRTPKEVCLARVAQRNVKSKNPIDLTKAAEFYDYWTNEVAPTYKFSLEVNGTDEQAAIQAIKKLIEEKVSVD